MVDSKRVKLSSAFAQVAPVPLAEAFRLKDHYLADENPDKINLSVGGEPTELNNAWAGGLKVHWDLDASAPSLSLSLSLQDRGGEAMGAAGGEDGGGTDELGPHPEQGVSPAAWDAGAHRGSDQTATGGEQSRHHPEQGKPCTVSVSIIIIPSQS